MTVEGNTTIEMDMNEFRHLGNFFVRIAADAYERIKGGYARDTDRLNFKEAILYMDKLGIPESEATGEEIPVNMLVEAIREDD